MLVPMDDRSRVESVSDLPRRSPDGQAETGPATLELLTHKGRAASRGKSPCDQRIITAVMFATAAAVTGCVAHSTAANPPVMPVVDAPGPAPKPIPVPVPKPIPVPAL
jgi:hypothetical protein